MEAHVVDQITFAEVDAALSRCMAVNPPEAPEFAQHPDAARMANLWAEMVCTGTKSVVRAHVDGRIVDAIKNWAI